VKRWLTPTNFVNSSTGEKMKKWKMKGQAYSKEL
jgi:hypothetical protein